MRWYLNDASLQAQFSEVSDFVSVLRNLLALRQQFDQLRSNLYVTRTFGQRQVRDNLSFVQLLGQPAYRETRSQVLRWLDRAGPFVDDDRSPEVDDYFEFEDQDVTNTGLGEATRRIRIHELATTFSFSGGTLNFARSPLIVDHGLPGSRLGSYEVSNLWSIEALRAAVAIASPPPSTWRELVETGRTRFSRLWLPDSLYLRDSLVREPFDSIICDRALELLAYLDRYMNARREDGSEDTVAQQIVKQFFVGDRALFSGESATNREKFGKQLSFSDPEEPGKRLFAPWHGKISHRYFRMHFEWPVPAKAARLKVVYLGPKITKG